MTISSEIRKAGPFNGNGITTSFPFAFTVFSKSEVRVVLTSPLNEEQTLTLDSDYSIDLNPNQNVSPGGTINYPLSGANLPSGWRLTAVGNLDYMQPADITNQGGFYPEVIEKVLDRQTMQIQQLSEGLGRAVKVSVSSLEPPEQLADELIQGAKDARQAAIDTNLDRLATQAAKNAAEEARDAAEESETGAAASASAATIKAAEAAEDAQDAAESAITAGENADRAVAARIQAEAAEEGVAASAAAAQGAASTAAEKADEANDERLAAEAARDTAVSANTQAQAAKVNAEAARDAAVEAKNAAEAAISAAQLARDQANAARDAANTAKAGAEAARAGAETARDQAITAKNDSAANAAAAQASATNAGNAADAAGANAIAAAQAADDAEAAAAVAENARDAAITARNAAQAAQAAAEAARDAAVAAKNQAQAAQTASEGARDASITARNASQAAQAASETARDQAVAAKNAAQAAQSAAETARDQAATARDAAQGYQSSASAYAQSASDSAAAAILYRNTAQAAADLVGSYVGMYPDEATGRAAVTDGKYFSTPSQSTSEYSILYRRTNSTTSQEIARYPSYSAVALLLSFFKANAPDGFAFAMMDGNNRASWGVKDDGTLAAAKVQATNLEVLNQFTNLVLKGYDLYIGDNALLTARYVKTGFVLDIQDSSGNTAVGLRDDGTLAVANLELLNGSLGGATQPDFGSEINHILIGGQSLDNGTLSLPILSTTQDQDSLRFVAGVRAYDGGDAAGDQATTRASFVPLTEQVYPVDGSLGETPGAGAAQMVKQLISSENGLAFNQQTYQLLVSCNGQGGQTLQVLNDTYFYRMQNDMLYGAQNSAALNKSYRCRAVLWAHGEADDAAKTDPGTYKTQFRAYIDRINGYLANTIGQNSKVKVITYQPVSHELVTFGMPGYPITGVALYEMAAQQADIVLACPNYFFPRVSDKAHLTNVSSKWLGAYYGLAYKRTVIDGGDFKPLMPLKGYRDKSIVVVEFNVPKPPLVFDTSVVAAAPNMGFRVLDATGALLTVTSATIVNQRYVKLKLSTTPTGKVTVQYAYKSEYSNNDRNGPTDGPRGNLRDSQGDTIRFEPSGLNLRMDNWCCMFALPVA